MSLSIREVSTSEADQQSARVFFAAVLGMFDLKKSVALDMFARTGELTVANYRKSVGEMHAWELMPEHEETLRENHNPDVVMIGCSYHTAQVAERDGFQFDFIVVDSPQGAHHDFASNTHFEHFDVVREVLPKIASEECIVVLYVNKAPYNKDEFGSHGYDQYSEYDYANWMDARKEFYGSEKITEEQAIAAYRKAVAEWATVEQVLTVPCFSDVPDYPAYAFRLALKLKRTHTFL